MAICMRGIIELLLGRRPPLKEQHSVGGNSVDSLVIDLYDDNDA